MTAIKTYSILAWCTLAMVLACATPNRVALGGQEPPTPAPPAEAADPQAPAAPCCPADGHSPPPQPATATPAEVAPSGDQHARASEWLEPKDRLPFDLDFVMTDQTGQAQPLSERIDRPTAMSFIFTRCPNPQLCPLITLTMAHLQRDLEAAGLANRVSLMLVSYDPGYDTPERLARYGQERGLEFTNAMMLRPEADSFAQLLSEFQIGVSYQPDGSIGHFVELVLIDHQGRFVRDYQGQVWLNAPVLADLKRLVQEQTVPPVDG